MFAKTLLATRMPSSVGRGVRHREVTTFTSTTCFNESSAIYSHLETSGINFVSGSFQWKQEEREKERDAVTSVFRAVLQWHT